MLIIAYDESSEPLKQCCGVVFLSFAWILWYTTVNSDVQVYYRVTSGSEYTVSNLIFADT